MAYTRVYLLPLVVWLLTVCGVLITYSLAVYREHVHPLLPYVSETGALPPEDAIFTLFMTVTAAIGLAFVYVRHRQLSEWTRLDAAPKPSPLVNLTASVFGAASCWCLALLGHFSVEDALKMHLVSATTAFWAGTVYFSLQAWFSYRLGPGFAPRHMVTSRIALIVLMVVSFGICIPTGFFSIQQFNGLDRRLWQPEHRGYGLHVISAVAEWIAILTYVSVPLTFMPEMRHVTIHSPLVQVNCDTPDTISVSLGEQKVAP